MGLSHSEGPYGGSILVPSQKQTQIKSHSAARILLQGLYLAHCCKTYLELICCKSFFNFFCYWRQQKMNQKAVLNCTVSLWRHSNCVWSNKESWTCHLFLTFGWRVCDEDSVKAECLWIDFFPLILRLFCWSRNHRSYKAVQLKQHKRDVALTASNEMLCNTLNNLCFPSSKKSIFLPLSKHSSRLACFVTLLDPEFL